jgi:hypothetical protein
VIVGTRTCSSWLTAGTATNTALYVLPVFPLASRSITFFAKEQLSEAADGAVTATGVHVSVAENDALSDSALTSAVHLPTAAELSLDVLQERWCALTSVA